MQTSYRLSVAELDERFLRSVRALFGSAEEQLQITISNERDDTRYLLSSEANRKHLEEALADVNAGRNLTDVPVENLNSAR
jgi:hypothetical protein